MMTKDELQTRIGVASFHQWLGLEVLEASEAGITVKAVWRDEWIVNPSRGYTHGGILATLVDVVADYALAAHLGGPAPMNTMARRDTVASDHPLLPTNRSRSESARSPARV